MKRERPVGPSLVRLARRFVARIFRPTPAEEVDEELGFHLEMVVRENIRNGMSPEEAREDALRRFRDIDVVKAECTESGSRRVRRDARREWLGDLAQDLRLTLRQLGKNRTFTAVVVATLAVGIGASTAVFSVVHGVILRPLPYPQPEDLVRVWTRFLPESGYQDEDFPASPKEAIEYREASQALATLAYYNRVSTLVTGDEGDPIRALTVASSTELMDVLRVRPSLGRWFSRAESRPEAAPVALLGHDLWTTRFGADPAVLGRSIQIDRTSTEIIGVMPRGFTFEGGSADLFRPMPMDEADPGGWGGHGVRVIGRLAAGHSLEQAGDELDGLVRFWRDEYGHPQQGHSLYLRPLGEDTVREVSTALWLLMGAVLLVLLVVAANVANLMLARGEARSGELALRVALGAGRGRVVRQLLTESLVLSAVGGGLGVALAAAAVPAALSMSPSSLPRSQEIGLDLPVLGFTAAVTVLVALLFGAMPALQLRQGVRLGDLGGDARSSGSRGGRRLRSGLIVGEVTLSLLVVMAAGLVARSFVEVVRVDPGMDPEGRLSFELSLPEGTYETPEEVRAGVAAVLEGVARVPGVLSASFTSGLPLGGSRYIPDFRIEGRATPTQGERRFSARVTVATPGFMDAAGIGLLGGRTFEPGDRNGSALVAIVNEETARVFWPGEDPMGRRIGFRMGGRDYPWVTIVGVARDTHLEDLQAELEPQIYLPHGQEQGFWAWNESSGWVVLRAGVDPSSLVPSLRRALREVDPSIPMMDARPLEDAVSESAAGPRYTATLLGGFGALALLLAMVGVYGVVAFSVAHRTREIGVRMALGADKGGVTSLMVAEGMRPVLLGVGLGLVLALAGSSWLEGLLYGVTPTDPATFVAVPLVLAAVALVACWIPSRRATRVPPTEALRQE